MDKVDSIGERARASQNPTQTFSSSLPPIENIYSFLENFFPTTIITWVKNNPAQGIYGDVAFPPLYSLRRGHPAGLHVTQEVTVEGLLRRAPPGRVQGQHSVQQVQGLVRQTEEEPANCSLNFIHYIWPFRGKTAIESAQQVK